MVDGQGSILIQKQNRTKGRTEQATVSAAISIFDLADATSLPPFNPVVLICLLAVVAAGGVIFFYLTSRWTTDRRRAAMEDWAAEERFRVRSAPAAELPPALHAVRSLDTSVELSLTRGPVVLLRLTTTTQRLSQPSRWHLLIRQLDRAWSPAGLRPVSQERSFIDLFSLTGYPSLLPPERFVVFASDARSARELAESPTRGLLPPDVGLMVHGPYVTIDFSQRPFDTIEFERMLVVMEQIVSHLPAQAEAPARS